jgi:hypothetical protein
MIHDPRNHRGLVAEAVLAFPLASSGIRTERSYPSTQLGYRQVLAAYLTALEQLREAVCTRGLP